MDALRRADVWDEVWAEYDARQVRRTGTPQTRAGERHAATPPGAAPALAAPRRAGWNPLLHAAAGLLAGAVLLLAWFALPWMLAARLSVPMGQGDAPGLMRQFDAPAAMGSLRDGLRDEVAGETGEGARRFLQGMADRMADSWSRPEAVASWLAVRNRGGQGEGSPAALSLRSARPVGLASFRLEYGPARGEGGVAFDMAWQGDAFRVTGVRFLRAPGTPPATPPGHIAVAMR